MGNFHAFAFCAEGQVYGWGDNTKGQLGVIEEWQPKLKTRDLNRIEPISKPNKKEEIFGEGDEFEFKKER